MPPKVASQIYAANQASDDEAYHSSEDEDYQEDGAEEGTSGYRKGSRDRRSSRDRFVLCVWVCLRVRRGRRRACARPWCMCVRVADAWRARARSRRLPSGDDRRRVQGSLHRCEEARLGSLFDGLVVRRSVRYCVVLILFYFLFAGGVACGARRVCAAHSRDACAPARTPTSRPLRSK